MEKITWDNPNKMHIESEWAKFNSQTNLICTGNVVANTQYSIYIRPECEVKCNGLDFPQGHLQKYDLDNFYCPQFIREWIKKLMKDRTESVIAYQFSVFDKGDTETFGYVVTTGNEEGYKLLGKKLVVPYRKSWSKRESALNEAIKYITN